MKVKVRRFGIRRDIQNIVKQLSQEKCLEEPIGIKVYPVVGEVEGLQDQQVLVGAIVRKTRQQNESHRGLRMLKKISLKCMLLF